LDNNRNYVGNQEISLCLLKPHYYGRKEKYYDGKAIQILIVTALFTTLSACGALEISGEENTQAENLSNVTNTDTDEDTQLSTGSPNLGVGSTQTNPVDDAMAVYIPAGEYKIGNEATANLLFVHTVYLDAFWIYQTEVTNAQFSESVAATGYQIGRFIEDVYMCKRIHSSLGYLTPVEYELQWQSILAVEAMNVV